ncbi:MAG: zinc ribbon domain-containing protein [Actinomycetota bacterium]|nr:zinc ribbon domain-containing protein [Actinomycetota bacterium]
MPIYSYKCKKCGKVFDKFQKFNENDGSNKTQCIYCNSDAVRVFSPVGIIFKGSGFYTTDYKSNSMNLSSSSVIADKDKEDKELSDSGVKAPGKEETGKKESDIIQAKPAK